MTLESKVAAAAASAAVFVPTTRWLLGLADVAIGDAAALGLVVGFVLLGGYLWPSRTSVVSSGFSTDDEDGQAPLGQILYILAIIFVATLVVVVLTRLL